jgi:hypothetical protein
MLSLPVTEASNVRKSDSTQGEVMSAKNGDRARFDREQKKNNLRRKNTRALRKKLHDANPKPQ